MLQALCVRATAYFKQYYAINHILSRLHFYSVDPVYSEIQRNYVEMRLWPRKLVDGNDDMSIVITI